MQGIADTAAAVEASISLPRPEILSGHSSLQASKLRSAQKPTTSEEVCMLLGRVAIPQRVQRYVTTAHITPRTAWNHNNSLNPP